MGPWLGYMLDCQRVYHIWRGWNGWTSSCYLGFGVTGVLTYIHLTKTSKGRKSNSPLVLLGQDGPLHTKISPDISRYLKRHPAAMQLRSMFFWEILNPSLLPKVPDRNSVASDYSLPPEVALVHQAGWWDMGDQGGPWGAMGGHGRSKGPDEWGKSSRWDTYI